MNISRILLTAFAILCWSRPSIAQPTQYVFEIPAYPGTEIFPFRSVGEQLFDAPFATITRVYKTSDGTPLDSAKVLGFYEAALRAKGWASRDPKIAAPYLSLSTQVYETPKDGTRIQAAGDFKIWVAPKDGMFTIWMKQWRISSPDDQTRKQVERIVETLKEFEKTAPLQNQLGENRDQNSNWEEFYANEYLIERRTFSIVDATRKDKSDVGFEGILQIELLTYRDEAVAQEESKRRRAQSASLQRGKDAIVTVGKNVVLIEDRSFQQTEKVAALAARLALLNGKAIQKSEGTRP